MKKLFLLFLLCASIFAHIEFEISLYEKVFPSIFDKDVIKVYTDKKNTKMFKKSKYFLVVRNCGDSDFVFGDIKDNDSLCVGIPKFVETYRAYKTKDDVFGVFYWRKGRPQLKFKRSVMKKFHLKMPKSISEYIQ